MCFHLRWIAFQQVQMYDWDQTSRDDAMGRFSLSVMDAYTMNPVCCACVYVCVCVCVCVCLWMVRKSKRALKY